MFSISIGGDDYLDFYNDNKFCVLVVFVNVNDGMLYVFYVKDGKEVFVYVFGFIVLCLRVLFDLDYLYCLLVDVMFVVSEVYVFGKWCSVLVLGLGGGG